MAVKVVNLRLGKLGLNLRCRSRSTTRKHEGPSSRPIAYCKQQIKQLQEGASRAVAASQSSRISIDLNTQPRGWNRSGEESGRVSAELKITRSSTNSTSVNATQWPCRLSHRTGVSCCARQPCNGLCSVDWIEKRQVGVEAIHRRNGIAGQADANIAPTAL